MIIIPAIDLINGECVRLEQGDYQKKPCTVQIRFRLLRPLPMLVQRCCILWILTVRGRISTKSGCSSKNFPSCTNPH